MPVNISTKIRALQFIPQVILKIHPSPQALNLWFLSPLFQILYSKEERKRYATVRCTLREYSLLLNLRVLLQLITGKKVLKLNLNLIPICCTILIYLLPLRMAREIVFNTLWPTLFHLIIFLHLIEHWLPNLTPFICPKLFKSRYRMGIAERQCKKR